MNREKNDENNQKERSHDIFFAKNNNNDNMNSRNIKASTDTEKYQEMEQKEKKIGSNETNDNFQTSKQQIRNDNHPSRSDQITISSPSSTSTGPVHPMTTISTTPSKFTLFKNDSTDDHKEIMKSNQHVENPNQNMDHDDLSEHPSSSIPLIQLPPTTTTTTTTTSISTNTTSAATTTKKTPDTYFSQSHSTSTDPIVPVIRLEQTPLDQSQILGNSETKKKEDSRDNVNIENENKEDSSSYDECNYYEQQSLEQKLDRNDPLELWTFKWSEPEKSPFQSFFFQLRTKREYMLKGKRNSMTGVCCIY